MAHPLNYAIEHAMKTAERNDEFADLPGAGKPLQNLHEPKDAVLGRILKEANAKPLAVSLKQQVAETRARLNALTDPEARKEVMRQLAELQLRLDLEMEAYRKYG